MSVPIVVFAVAVVLTGILASLVVLSLWLGDKLQELLDKREWPR